MKKIQGIILLCLTLMGAFVACDKIDELTHFKLEYQKTVTIPSSAVVDLPFNVQSPEIESNAETEFESNHTRKDLVEKIELTKMELRIKSPEDGNFNFLNSIEVYIYSEQHEEVKIAYLEDIPADGRQKLKLNTVRKNLMKYIKEDHFKLRLATRTDEVITRNHEILVDTEFFVDAKILGI